MARYTYNPEIILTVLEELKEASSSLSTTENKFAAGLDEIANARGAEHLPLDGTILTYPSLVETNIETIASNIVSKVQAIEEYNNAGILTHLFSTRDMITSKIREGIFTAGENIIDGVATIVGFTGGLFNSNFEKSVGNFIKNDYVGNFYKKQYSTGILSNAEKYSMISSESTGANILKGFGIGTGYIGAIALTGGAAGIASGTGMAAGATTAMSSVAVDTVFASLGGLGEGQQRSMQSGKSFDEALKDSVKQAMLQGGLSFGIGKSMKLFSSGTKSSKMITNSDNMLESYGSKADEILTGERKLISISDETSNIFNKSFGKNSDDVLKLTTSKGSINELTLDQALGNTNLTKSIKGMSNDLDNGTQLFKNMSKTIEKPKYISNLEESLGIKFDYISSETIGKTTIPQNVKIKINGITFDVGGNVVNDTSGIFKTSGATKHISENIANSVKRTKVFDLEKLNAWMNENASSRIFKSDASESSITKAIKNVLKKQGKDDTLAIGIKDSFTKSGEFTTKITQKELTKLEKLAKVAGMEDKYQQIASKGIDNITVKEVEQFTGETSQSIYLKGLKELSNEISAKSTGTYLEALDKYPINESILRYKAIKGPGIVNKDEVISTFKNMMDRNYVPESIYGVPRVVNVGTSEAPYYIEYITKEIVDGESSSVKVFHMIHNDSITQEYAAVSARNQGVKLVTRYTSPTSRDFQSMISAHKDLFPKTIEEYSSIPTEAKIQLMDTVKNETRSNIIQSITTGKDIIKDPSLNDLATISINRYLESSDFESIIDKTIKQLYTKTEIFN